jgi:hypothetical protein
MTEGRGLSAPFGPRSPTTSPLTDLSSIIHDLAATVKTLPSTA